MIEKKQLPETDLIVRDKWIEYNEDNYTEESQKFFGNSEQAGDAAAAASSARDYTGSEFHGASGTKMYELTHQRTTDLNASEERHTAVGRLLQQAASNISRNKSEINDAQQDYHDKFEEACRKSGEEGWPQQHLNDVKRELVQAAQGRVDNARTAFDNEHSRITRSVSGALDT